MFPFVTGLLKTFKNPFPGEGDHAIETKLSETNFPQKTSISVISPKTMENHHF